jgi:hypothetical protein
MTKLTKRFVEAVEPQSKGHVIWDDDLPGFGLRVYPSGKRSYLIQYRSKGRSRRYTIGIHGVWTPETARREAKALLGQIAQGGDPAAEREEERRAVTVRELSSSMPSIPRASTGGISGRSAQRPSSAGQPRSGHGGLSHDPPSSFRPSPLHRRHRAPRAFRLRRFPVRERAGSRDRTAPILRRENNRNGRHRRCRRRSFTPIGHSRRLDSCGYARRERGCPTRSARRPRCGR